jgi:squalene-hopene/tetraprenyl-beta-curcumene cyclase
VALLVALTLPARSAGPDAKDVQALVEKAHAFLAKSQGENGSFSPQIAGPGITAVVVAGLLQNGYGPEDPVVAKGLAYLEKTVKKDGGIYDKRLANYTTSIGLLAFREANAGGKYDAIIKNATAFLKKLQSGDDPENAAYGGVGYDGKTRPDLSNTNFFLDALQAAGVPRDDPAVQRALKFVSRCQNLPGETNDQAFAKKATDDDKGGLVYKPFVDPDDKLHTTAEGGLRSMGAMTYGGLKSFLYAGVSKDDPRVKGAVRWMRTHYTLDENPGMKQAGLYYYFHTFGKAMAALGEDLFEDARGTKHDWRRELFEAVKKRQRPDGSFINPGEKMFAEADPNLATGFALLAVSYTRPVKK